MASLLAPALVGGLILTYGPPVQAAPQDAPAGTSRQAFTDGLYVVQLADSPVATDPRTAPKPGGGSTRRPTPYTTSSAT